MRKIFYILTLLLGALSCRSLEPDSREGDALPADLTVSVSLPAVETKAPGYSDGNVAASDAASWSVWDRLVDGQVIYRLTLFLVKMPENKLVGYRDLYKNSPDYYGGTDSYGPNGFCQPDGTMLPIDTLFATCAKAHFSYLNPRHGATEKLGSGSYRIYAVANYSSITAKDSNNASKTYSGLADDSSSLNDIIHATSTGIIPQFTAASGAGLSNFDRDHYGSFFDYKVKSAVESGVDQFVCEQRPQPLTFVTEDFLVLSGTNEISAELVRTYSRIRIVLNNDSETEKLTLNEFSFVTPVAQNEACIFDLGDDAVKYSSSLEGKPVLNSIHCIHHYPGDGNLTIDPEAATPEHSKVVFDAYVLESKRGADKYQYKVDVEYTGVSSPAITIASGTPIKTLAALKTAYNAGTYKFLLRPVSSDKGFLYDNTLNTSESDEGKRRVIIENYSESATGGRAYLDQNIQNSSARSTALIVSSSDGSITRKDGGNLEDLRLDQDYKTFIWSFEKNGDWNFDIMNELTGQYWNKLLTANASERLKTVAVDYFHYEPGEKSGSSGLRFRNAYPTGSTIYLHRDCYGTTSSSDNNTLFHLYPLSSGDPARAVKTVNLQVLDHDTHQPYDLEEFKRNDFITVNIFTSIRPDGGFLEFKVIPWNAVNGDITFE